MSRRAPHLSSWAAPRRPEAAAALGVAAVLIGLFSSPVALGVAAAAHAVSRVSRWRPAWLALPAGCGLAWALQIGAGPAVAGFTALPHAVMGCLARAVADPAVLTQLAHALGLDDGKLIGRRLAGQLPLGLILGAAAAAAAARLDWLRGGRAPLPGTRPGLVSWARRQIAAALIRSGSVLTLDGVRLGIDPGSGAPVSVSWAQAEQAVLITAGAGADAAAPAFQFLQAAIRLRKPVIAVDLRRTGSELAGAVAAACAAADAPLQVFGSGDAVRYEPWRGRDPALAAALVAGMLDWSQLGDAARLHGAAWLEEVFATPRDGSTDARVAVLDGLIAALRQGAIGASAAAALAEFGPAAAATGPGPAGPPGARAAASGLAENPELAAFLADQLAALRASPVGRRLGPENPVCSGPAVPASRPGPDSAGLDLAGALRRRAVVLFPFGQTADGRIASMAANLVALDTATTWSQARGPEGMNECLAWFAGVRREFATALRALISAARGGGLAIVLTPDGLDAAAALTPHAGVLIEHGQAGEFTLAAAAEAGLAPRRGLLVPGRVPGQADPLPAARFARGPRRGASPEPTDPAGSCPAPAPPPGPGSTRQAGRRE